jgi:hypothetical protein
MAFSNKPRTRLQIAGVEAFISIGRETEKGLTTLPMVTICTIRFNGQRHVRSASVAYDSRKNEIIFLYKIKLIDLRNGEESK